jgi:hypothetical protein
MKLGGRASLTSTQTVPWIIFQRPVVVHEARRTTRAPPDSGDARGKRSATPAVTFKGY